MSEHTPTPWALFNVNGTIAIKNPRSKRSHNEIVFWTGFDASHYPEQALANAAFIVRAVNTHDALVKALSWFIGDDPAMEDVLWGSQPDDALMTIRVKYSAYKQAREILTGTRPVVEPPSTPHPRLTMTGSREELKLAPIELVDRIEAYLDDAPSNGGHSDAAGGSSWELLREAMDVLRHPAQTSPGLAAVAAERKRQINVEGWSAAHDDEHTDGSMATAAAVYALHPFRWHLVISERTKTRLLALTDFWPWEIRWFKPTNRRRNLEKAGALIVAELDRLIRAEYSTCAICSGSGYSNHPDSGEICQACAGQGVEFPASSVPSTVRGTP